MMTRKALMNYFPTTEAASSRRRRHPIAVMNDASGLTWRSERQSRRQERNKTQVCSHNVFARITIAYRYPQLQWTNGIHVVSGKNT